MVAQWVVDVEVDVVEVSVAVVVVVGVLAGVVLAAVVVVVSVLSPPPVMGKIWRAATAGVGAGKASALS